MARRLFPDSCNTWRLKSGPKSSRGSVGPANLGCRRLQPAPYRAARKDGCRQDCLPHELGSSNTEPRLPEQLQLSYGRFIPIAPPYTINSTLRFCCFPAAVSLLATGVVLPKPFAVTLAAATPCETRKSRTAFARCSESVWLYSSPPTLSVCPSTW